MSSKSVNKLLKEANSLLTNNDTQGAIKITKKILKEDSDNYWALLLYGKAVLLTGSKKHEAIEAFKKAANIKPTGIDCWKALLSCFEGVKPLDISQEDKIVLQDAYYHCLELETDINKWKERVHKLEESPSLDLWSLLGPFVKSNDQEKSKICCKILAECFSKSTLNSKELPLEVVDAIVSHSKSMDFYDRPEYLTKILERFVSANDFIKVGLLIKKVLVEFNVKSFKKLNLGNAIVRLYVMGPLQFEDLGNYLVEVGEYVQGMLDVKSKTSSMRLVKFASHICSGDNFALNEMLELDNPPYWSYSNLLKLWCDIKRNDWASLTVGVKVIYSNWDDITRDNRGTWSVEVATMRVTAAAVALLACSNNYVNQSVALELGWKLLKLYGVSIDLNYYLCLAAIGLMDFKLAAHLLESLEEFEFMKERCIFLKSLMMKPDDAIAYLQQFPPSPLYSVHLGILHALVGNFKTSSKTLRSIIRSYPVCVNEPFLLLGLYNYCRNNLTKASDYLVIAYANQKHCFDSLKPLILVKKEENSLDDVVPFCGGFCESLMAYEDEGLFPILKAGLYYLKTGCLESSVECLRHCVVARPESKEFLYLLIVGYMCLGRLKSAFNIGLRLLEQPAVSPLELLTFAKVHKCMGQIDLYFGELTLQIFEGWHPMARTLACPEHLGLAQCLLADSSILLAVKAIRACQPLPAFSLLQLSISHSLKAASLLPFSAKSWKLLADSLFLTHHFPQKVFYLPSSLLQVLVNSPGDLVNSSESLHLAIKCYYISLKLETETELYKLWYDIGLCWFKLFFLERNQEYLSRSIECCLLAAESASPCQDWRILNLLSILLVHCGESELAWKCIDITREHLKYDRGEVLYNWGLLALITGHENESKALFEKAGFMDDESEFIWSSQLIARAASLDSLTFDDQQSQSLENSVGMIIKYVGSSQVSSPWLALYRILDPSSLFRPPRSYSGFITAKPCQFSYSTDSEDAGSLLLTGLYLLNTNNIILAQPVLTKAFSLISSSPEKSTLEFLVRPHLKKFLFSSDETLKDQVTNLLSFISGGPQTNSSLEHDLPLLTSLLKTQSYSDHFSSRFPTSQFDFFQIRPSCEASNIQTLIAILSLNVPELYPLSPITHHLKERISSLLTLSNFDHVPYSTPIPYIHLVPLCQCKTLIAEKVLLHCYRAQLFNQAYVIVEYLTKHAKHLINYEKIVPFFCFIACKSHNYNYCSKALHDNPWNPTLWKYFSFIFS